MDINIKRFRVIRGSKSLFIIAMRCYGIIVQLSKLMTVVKWSTKERSFVISESGRKQWDPRRFLSRWCGNCHSCLSQ